MVSLPDGPHRRGQGPGGLSYRLSLSKRAAMKRAVTAAFAGQLDDRELAQILKGSFFDLWWEVLGSKPNRIDAEATTKARVIGWNHLEHALAAGKGVILWENGNFGRRFWSKQILAQRGAGASDSRLESPRWYSKSTARLQPG